MSLDFTRFGTGLMRLVDFDFSLPDELIAQQPAATRDASRLMCLDRRDGSIRAQQFTDILNYFNPGDVLVINDTRDSRAVAGAEE